MKEKNKGFTLVELIVVVSIFAILLGIMEPSVSSIFNFRAQRAANSIAAALDKTKTEAMNRLVGEMVLEKRSDGYYISYYLHRGKTSGVVEEQAEKIAPKSTYVTYTTTQNPTPVEMEVDTRLIITYNREDGSFRPLQTSEVTTEEVNEALERNKDVAFHDEAGSGDTGNYCTSIIVKGGFRTRTVKLDTATGSCTVTAG